MQSRVRSRALARAAVAAALPFVIACPCAAADPAAPAATTKPATSDSAKPALPDGKTVLARFVEVTGGRAAYAKRTSITVSGTLAVPAMGLSGQLTILQAAPGKMATIAEIPGMGAIVRGTDGTHAWEVNPMMGPRLLEGDEKDEAILGAQMNADLEPEAVYSKIETLALEEVDGKPAYKLELTPKRGAGTRTCWYEKESGLMVKVSTVAKTQMGDITAETTVSDYRDEGGIKVPHKLTQRAMGAEQVMTFTTVSYAPIPDEKFAPPPEIQKLLAPSAAAPAK